MFTIRFFGHILARKLRKHKKLESQQKKGLLQPGDNNDHQNTIYWPLLFNLPLAIGLLLPLTSYLTMIIISIFCVISSPSSPISLLPHFQFLLVCPCLRRLPCFCRHPRLCLSWCFCHDDDGLIQQLPNPFCSISPHAALPTLPFHQNWSEVKKSFHWVACY